MLITYVKNTWGKCLPIEFKTCCEAMTLSYSPEGIKGLNGYMLDTSSAEFVYFHRGKESKLINECPFCKSKIETQEKELK